jgi:competence protein ComEC
VRRALRFLSNHLLVALTLAFSGGIAAAFFARLDATTLAPLHVTVSLCVAVLLALFLFSRGDTFRLSRQAAQLSLTGGRQAMPLLLPPLLALLGFYHGLTHLQPPSSPDHLFHRFKEKQEAAVVGTLLAAPEFDGRISRVEIASSHLRLPEDQKFVPTQGTLLLHLAAPWPANLLPGDSLVVRANLKHPESFQSPGAFDYQRHLAFQGIFASGFSRSPYFVHKVEERQNFWQRLRYAPERARTSIGSLIDSAVDEEHRGLYRAILIGDSSAINDEVMESFKASGTVHILAISGLHMTIIGSLLYACFYWLLSRSERLLINYPLRKWAAFLCLPALFAYGLLAGLNVPVFRAMIMSCIAIVGICSDRVKSPSTLLALAALIILSIDPLSLAQPSFQLSFVATGAILFLVPILKESLLPDHSKEFPSLRERSSRWLLAGIVVSVAATAATAPITLYAFNRVSTVGIIANLVIEPLICLWSLPCGFLALPFTALSPDIATFLLRLGAPGLTAAVDCAAFFANLPFSSLWRPSPPGWLLTLSGIGFFAMLVARRWSAAFFGATSLFVVSLAAMIFPSPLATSRESVKILQMVALDVGQGSSNLVRFPSGKAVLIDGGGSAATKPSVGERVIAPYLWMQGISRLDAVVITHPDADHYNGIPFILKHFTPETLWVRDLQGHDHGYQEVLRMASRLGVAIRVPEVGETFPGLGVEESLSCLATQGDKIPGSAPGTKARDNNGLVLKACYRQHCALLPGDIDRREEARLIDSEANLRADLLVSPHHGSKTSNTPRFLAAVAPQILVVSAGKSGQGRFPHPLLKEECRALGIAMASTSEHGSLTAHLGLGQSEFWGYGRPGDNPFNNWEPIRLRQ